jgi:hypothetical protein
MFRQTVNDVTYHAKRKTRYKNDCIENEWKGVTNNTNNWDSKRTNMSEVLCPAGLTFSYVKNAVSTSGNVPSNGYNDWGNER